MTLPYTLEVVAQAPIGTDDFFEAEGACLMGVPEQDGAVPRPAQAALWRLDRFDGRQSASAASRTYLRRPSWARPISSRTSDVTPAISIRSTAEAGSVVSCVPASKAIMSRPLRIPTT